MVLALALASFFSSKYSTDSLEIGREVSHTVSFAFVLHVHVYRCIFLGVNKVNANCNMNKENWDK